MSSALRIIASIALMSAMEADGFFRNIRYNGMEEWSTIRHIQVSAPMIVKVDNRLVHVLDSREGNHALQLESTESKTCKVPLVLRYPSRYPRRAISLANGKLVVWLLNYRFTPYKHVGEWRFVIVDPRGCTCHGFEITDVDPTPVDVIDVVGYQDTFDLFITGLSHDQPRYTHVYRYDDKAKPVSSVLNSPIPDVDSYPFYQPNTIRVHSAKDYETTDGYFYLQVKPSSNSTIVKRLDSKFQFMKSIVLKYSGYHGFDFDGYSTSHGNFSVCRFIDEEKHYLHCSLYDTWLNEKTNITLGYDDYDEDLSKLMHLKLVNLPDGDALLAFATNFDHRLGTSIYLQRIASSGQVSEPMSLGKINCEIYELEMFEMKNSTYCIGVSCDELAQTRCVQLED